jgi:hypothetical protein
MNKPRGLRWSLGSCFGNARLLGYIKVPPPLLPSDNLCSVDLAIPIGARKSGEFQDVLDAGQAENKKNPGGRDAEGREYDG